MNHIQLEKLGITGQCAKAAIAGIQAASKARQLHEMNVPEVIASVIADPATYTKHAYFGQFAQAILAEREFVRPEPITYQTWGSDGIDAGAHQQMRQACSMPIAAGAALMADAHIGYGLPIGGVLALRNAVCPFAVGVDIACRMKLSILDMEPATLKSRNSDYVDALVKGTFFGVGQDNPLKPKHPVLDANWSVTKVTRDNKDKARRQLGTSGSGNHFVEFGIVSLPRDDLGLKAGEYVALMSHSGSRGTGATVCNTFSAAAQANLIRNHTRYSDLRRLAWLELDTQEGQDYWNAMNLMGDYAAANHDVIHRNVSLLLGSQIIAGVENHHNFAWKETHHGEEVVVHRKGATPAGAGMLGVIPGSMGTPAFIVRGLGNTASLNSASHGAGRRMSRTAALGIYDFAATKAELAKQDIQVLSAGADEVPGVYKDIHEVMRAQADLVDIVGQFTPRIVRMSDGGKAED